MLYGVGALAESASFGSGASKVEAFVARLIAATLSCSARAFFASCNISAREYRVENRRRSNFCGRRVFRFYRGPESSFAASRRFGSPGGSEDSSADELRVGVVARWLPRSHYPEVRRRRVERRSARLTAGCGSCANRGALFFQTHVGVGRPLSIDRIGHTRRLLRRSRRRL